uniref:Uncharacterized protein n=1 Tax=Anopheles coluzzii TaxID=1518534 RepID=A0A8W7Q2N5_ANOCL
MWHDMEMKMLSPCSVKVFVHVIQLGRKVTSDLGPPGFVGDRWPYVPSHKVTLHRQRNRCGTFRLPVALADQTAKGGPRERQYRLGQRGRTDHHQAQSAAKTFLNFSEHQLMLFFRTMPRLISASFELSAMFSSSFLTDDRCTSANTLSYTRFSSRGTAGISVGFSAFRSFVSSLMSPEKKPTAPPI